MGSVGDRLVLDVGHCCLFFLSFVLLCLCAPLAVVFRRVGVLERVLWRLSPHPRCPGVWCLGSCPVPPQRMYSSYTLFSTVIYPLLQPLCCLIVCPLTICPLICAPVPTGYEPCLAGLIPKALLVQSFLSSTAFLLSILQLSPPTELIHSFLFHTWLRLYP